jgi:hypothetical protein
VFMIGMHGVKQEIHGSVCSVIKCLYGCHHCRFSLLTRLLKFIYYWKIFFTTRNVPSFDISYMS